MTTPRERPGADVTRLKLIVAYDGRPFQGWQSQAGGGAVQDYLEAAFADLCGTPITIHGAGRTDAGVHALGQVAHADVPPRNLTPERWQFALNARLPAEIRVMRVTRTRPDFHARFDARGKVYLYRIWNSPVLSPLEIGRVWHVPTPLDPDLLRRSARLLTGRHDFAAFAANRGTPPKTTVRTIHSITVTRRGPLITLRYTGDGFLYKMVRLLTGSIVRVAQAREPLTWLEQLLTRPGKTSFAAPAEGLSLQRVLY